jgi:hypothetical protein
MTPERKIVSKLAELAHFALMLEYDDEPLDGNQTEELSVMFQEELNKLNGNDTNDEL